MYSSFTNFTLKSLDTPVNGLKKLHWRSFGSLLQCLLEPLDYLGWPLVAWSFWYNAPLAPWYPPLEQQRTAAYWAVLEMGDSWESLSLSPSRPSSPYALGHGNCSPQGWHSYLGLLKAGWSKTWAPDTSTCRSGQLPLAQVPCQIPGAHSSPRLPDCLESPLGLTEWTVMGVVDHANVTANHPWWSLWKAVVFHPLARLSLKKDRTPKPPLVETSGSHLSTGCPGQQLASSSYLL